jgi:uncharacterized protein YecE (DUF72 family)
VARPRRALRRSQLRPRRRGRLFTGTSGYVYADWRRRFYPRGLPAHAWLAYYAKHFPTVELNAPFYRLPSAEVFARWRAQVPAGYVFAVKASRYLTHLKRLKEPRAPLALFLRRARHLGPALGPVLFQLPGRFHLDLPRLDGFLDALDRQRLVRPLRAVLEVRHPSWLTPAVFERLGRANVALCLSDWQDAPVTDVVTADFIYIRRHGLGRYAGRYSDEALGADALRIASWLEGGRDVYVYFNNDARAHAVDDARSLVQLVRPPGRAA